MQVSVAIATYNGERFLPEQLASIARQDRCPDELVICDDASQDSTEQIVRDFAKTAPLAVRFQKNPHNIGSNGSFARAIADCTGDVIFLADQDDFWLPHKTQRLMQCLEEDPETGLVFSNAFVVSEDRKRHGSTLWTANGLPKQNRNFRPEFHWFNELLRRNVVTGATMAFRSEYRQLLLPFPADTVHDHWIALMISALTSIIGVSEPLMEYRQHSHQQIGPPKPLWQRIKRAWALEPADYQRAAAPYEAARQRLAACSKKPHSSVLNALDEKLRHQAIRASSQARCLRVPLILKELAAGNYHRFDFGFVSAAKDLLR